MPTATQETLVVQDTPEGIRVYDPAEPGNLAFVTGTRRVPSCTCPDFQTNVHTDPRYWCRHIEAASDKLPVPTETGPTPAEERAAIQSEGTTNPSAVPAQMLFKRSISPDGRIDSLSIEFSCPVPVTLGEIKSKAFKTLSLQDEIAEAFRREHVRQPAASLTNGRNGTHTNGNGGYRPPEARTAPAGEPAPDGSVPATLVDVSGMQTRNGWAFFLNVAANGQNIRLFGKRNELGEAITAAGYPQHAGNIQKGTRLNLPCRVILTQNGRYTNVERVLPANGGYAQ